MEAHRDESSMHPVDSLTDYCFGELSESVRESVERHLFVCDECWNECQRVMTAVAILRSDAAGKFPLAPGEVVSELGVSGRVHLPFAGHRKFALGVTALFAVQFLLGVWVELGYSYSRFGHLAWRLSWPAGLGAWINAICALHVDTRAIRRGRADGLLRSLGLMVAGIGLLTLAVVSLLPAEQTILASFQTRTAAAGYLKDVLIVFVPVLAFILPSYHTVTALQESVAAGRYEPVLATLTARGISVPPRGILYLSPRALGVLFLVLGVMRVAGANHMLDALSPGPYSQLFSIMTYLNVAAWLAATMWAMWWFWASLNEVKRDAIALARLSKIHNRSEH